MQSVFSVCTIFCLIHFFLTNEYVLFKGRHAQIDLGTRYLQNISNRFFHKLLISQDLRNKTAAYIIRFRATNR